MNLISRGKRKDGNQGAPQSTRGRRGCVGLGKRGGERGEDVHDRLSTGKGGHHFREGKGGGKMVEKGIFLTKEKGSLLRGGRNHRG